MYPVLLDLGEGLVVYSYSVFLALGYLVAYWVVSADVSRRKMDPSLPATLLLACFIAGLVGAKILFLYQNATLTEFLANPVRYFISGYSSVGGLVGVFCALWVVSRIRKTDFQILLDLVCPALILGYRPRQRTHGSVIAAIKETPYPSNAVAQDEGRTHKIKKNLKISLSDPGDDPESAENPDEPAHR
jgi:hypothetical protein